MDSYTLSHYRRKAESWFTTNFKFLREIDSDMVDIFKLVTAGFTVLYGVIVAVRGMAMASDGVTILYAVLLKTSFAIALKFALPVILVVGGIMYIVDLVN